VDSNAVVNVLTLCERTVESSFALNKCKMLGASKFECSSGWWLVITITAILTNIACPGYNVPSAKLLFRVMPPTCAVTELSSL